MAKKTKNNSAAVLAAAKVLVSKKLGIAALMVERTAKLPGYCPVLTGTARRSILSNWYGAPMTRSLGWAKRTKTVKGKKYRIKAGKTSIAPPTTMTAIIGSNIEYFPYIEIGTAKMAAQAPLRRALETNMSRIRKLFGK